MYKQSVKLIGFKQDHTPPDQLLMLPVPDIHNPSNTVCRLQSNTSWREVRSWLESAVDWKKHGLTATCEKFSVS